MIERLLEDGATILKSDPMLFENFTFRFTERDSFIDFTLYLLQNKQKKFIVYSSTYYRSDNNFVNTLQAHDSISHPISLDLYREFTLEKSAMKFYEDVLSSCPKPFDFMSLFKNKMLDKDNFSYRYSGTEDVHYDYHKKGWVDHDERYVKEFARHGYQRVMLRIFRIDTSLIINKRVGIRFESKERCKEALDLIKSHFDSYEMTTFDYKGEDDCLERLFQKLILISMDSNNLTISVKKDNLKRTTSLDLSFSLNEKNVSIRYKLPSRNGDYHGYTMDGHISFNGFRLYSHERGFVEKLKEIVKAFE